MKNIAIIVLVLVVIGLGFAFTNRESQTLGQAIPPNLALGVNSNVTATTTVKLILADKSSGKLRVLSNVGIYDFYYSATTTNLAVGAGALLRPSSTIVMSGDSLYTGILYGIAAGTTTIGIFSY